MLRFTAEETAAIVKMQYGNRAAPSAAVLRQLHARTHGWAAGLILLLESPDAMAATGPPMDEGSQTTFDYFASEVFQHMDAGSRALLPALAIPLAVSATMADALTGSPRAGQRLEELVRANCFTTRHASGHYQFHPLFRNFLLDVLRNSATESDRRRLQRSAANLLISEDRPEEAAQLLIDAADWSRLTALIVQNGQALLAQGRHETLGMWLHALPADLRNANPWMLFYLGATRLPFDFAEARVLFEQATERFNDDDSELAGLVLAWSGTVQAIGLAWSDASLLGRWIAFAEQKIVPRLAELAPPLRGQAIQGMFVAYQFNRPHHPDMRKWTDLLETTVRQCADPGDKLRMGAVLLPYYAHWLGDLVATERIIRLIQPQRPESLSAEARLYWHVHYMLALAHHASSEAMLAEGETGQALAAKCGVRIWDFLFAINGAHASLNAQDTVAAERFLDQAERLTSPDRPQELVHYTVMRARRARDQGDAESARRSNEWAAALIKPKCGAFELSVVLVELAHSQRACGDHVEALANAEQALALARSIHGRWTERL